VTVTQAVERLVKASVHLSDTDLDKKYVWEAYDDDGLRFALLTAHHLLRETTATVAAARLGAGKPFTEAQRILAQVHEHLPARARPSWTPRRRMSSGPSARC